MMRTRWRVSSACSEVNIRVHSRFKPISPKSRCSVLAPDPHRLNGTTLRLRASQPCFL